MNCINQVDSAMTNFKGTAISDNGMPYYKSNKGTIAGAIIAVPTALSYALPKLLNNNEAYKAGFNAAVKKNLNSDKNLLEAIHNRLLKCAVPFAITMGACTLGCGILFDHIRNKNAKETLDDNYQEPALDIEDIEYTQDGMPWYKSDNGVAFGAITGTLCGIVNSILSHIREKGLGGINLGSILTIPLFTIGGMIVSAITSKAANKAAAKVAYSESARAYENK